MSRRQHVHVHNYKARIRVNHYIRTVCFLPLSAAESNDRVTVTVPSTSQRIEVRVGDQSQIQYSTRLSIAWVSP